jgi:hypothetical protein
MRGVLDEEEDVEEQTNSTSSSHEEAAAQKASSRESADKETVAKIDLYIRTSRRFNTSNPVEYACNIDSIDHECHREVSHIISTFDRFRLHGNTDTFPEGTGHSYRHFFPRVFPLFFRSVRHKEGRGRQEQGG